MGLFEQVARLLSGTGGRSSAPGAGPSPGPGYHQETPGAGGVGTGYGEDICLSSVKIVRPLDLRNDPARVEEALLTMNDRSFPLPNGDEKYTLEGAVKWLDSVENDDPHRFVIYGSGGTHRYYACSDGSVIFSKFHSSTPESQLLAASLGFKVE